MVNDKKVFIVRAIRNKDSAIIICTLLIDVLMFIDQDDEISFAVRHKTPWERSNNSEYTTEHSCKNQ